MSDPGLRFRREAAEDVLPPVGKHMTGEMRKRRRKRLIERDGLACSICGGLMTAKAATIDHIVPISKGGSNEMANLRLAHQRCNGTRGNAVDQRTEAAQVDQQDSREK